PVAAEPRGDRKTLSSTDSHITGHSKTQSYDLREVLQLPEPLALARLQTRLHSALHDKQNVSFRGEVTVMKFIGG
ncbi:MAG: hypothetical protein AAF993_21265, partial [Pseudomonadota bacterium]